MYQKIIIIGAPRSGTNMLRNTLVKLKGVETWPCDEINYIWRNGHAKVSTDEFTVDMASPMVKSYIRKSFDQIAAKTAAGFVIEKTCANSLRVPFVDAIVPDAKYIFIVRDGLDAIASASLRWQAKLDLPYILRKLRYVPISDIPVYGAEYIKNRLHMKSSLEGRQAYWGPKILSLSVDAEHLSLLEICATQWNRCVESATDSFRKVENERLISIKYEDFVFNPLENIERIVDFIGMDASIAEKSNAVSGISSSNVGKGRIKLDIQSIDKIMPIISSMMNEHDYDLK